MHALVLAQVAATVAMHARQIIHSGARFPDAALELYWSASKCRHDRWARTLKSLNTAPDTHDDTPSTIFQTHIEPTLDEVMTSEILTRVWAAVCYAIDRRRGEREAGPFARSVLAGHLEMRHRVLSLMVYGYSVGVEEAVVLNRRRLRHERCTDKLLALFVDHEDIAECGFEPRRIKEWGRGAFNNQRFGQSFCGAIGLATLISNCRQSQSLTTSNGDLNRRIASSVLGCFPPPIFGYSGAPISRRYLSLMQASHDSKGKLNLPEKSESIADADELAWFDFRNRQSDPH